MTIRDIIECKDNDKSLPVVVAVTKNGITFAVWTGNLGDIPEELRGLPAEPGWLVDAQKHQLKVPEYELVRAIYHKHEKAFSDGWPCGKIESDEITAESINIYYTNEWFHYSYSKPYSETNTLVWW